MRMFSWISAFCARTAMCFDWFDKCHTTLESSVGYDTVVLLAVLIVRLNAFLVEAHGHVVTGLPKSKTHHPVGEMVCFGRIQFLNQILTVTYSCRLMIQSLK